MATERNRLQRFFDVWSRFYDLPLAQRLLYRPVQDAVVAELRLGDRPRAVLDVGCGTGILASRIAAEFTDSHVVGCDLSAGMLAQAARRPGRVDWVRTDAQRLPFDSGAFDAVCCTESFHWYPDQPAALREFARVLAPGGRLLLALLAPAVAPLYRPPGDGTPSRRHLRAMVGDARFAAVVQRRVRHPIVQTLIPNVLTVAEAG